MSVDLDRSDTGVVSFPLGADRVRARIAGSSHEDNRPSAVVPEAGVAVGSGSDLEVDVVALGVLNAPLVFLPEIGLRSEVAGDGHFSGTGVEADCPHLLGTCDDGRPAGLVFVKVVSPGDEADGDQRHGDEPTYDPAQRRSLPILLGAKPANVADKLNYYKSNNLESQNSQR